MITSAEIYDAGYAVPMYDILTDIQHFRFREEEFELKRGAVVMYDYPGIKFQVAKIEDIKWAARGR